MFKLNVIVSYIPEEVKTVLEICRHRMSIRLPNKGTKNRLPRNKKLKMSHGKFYLLVLRKYKLPVGSN